MSAPPHPEKPINPENFPAPLPRVNEDERASTTSNPPPAPTHSLPLPFLISPVSMDAHNQVAPTIVENAQVDPANGWPLYLQTSATREDFAWDLIRSRMRKYLFDTYGEYYLPNCPDMMLGIQRPAGDLRSPAFTRFIKGKRPTILGEQVDWALCVYIPYSFSVSSF